MCHMKVTDRYKTWHGLCHMDDALMAPVNHNHFDGYFQVRSTLNKYKSGEHVPGLNIGGWHDAGDYDLRIESQAETIYKLSLAYEFFKNDYDETTINQETRVVEIHKPDGRPDILQQIEHGVLSIVSSYESMGRLYRGIQETSLQQYVHLGDASTITDNLVYNENEKDRILSLPLPKDDRLVFTEKNPQRELYTAQVLAAASRVLAAYNHDLANKCLAISEELYESNSSIHTMSRISAVSELYLTTSKSNYRSFLMENIDSLSSNIMFVSETIGRVTAKIGNNDFTKTIEEAVGKTFEIIIEQQKENPYGVPYRPVHLGSRMGHSVISC